MSHRNDSNLVRYVSRSYRSLPTDVTVVAGTVLLADVLILLLPEVAFLRVAVGLPLLFFVPGYALVTVLFPEGARARRPSDASEDRRNAGGASRLRRRSIDGVERVALSFGTSLALVPVVLLVTAGFETLSTVPVLVTTNVVVGCLLAAGTVRRRATPEADRFEVSTHRVRESVFPRGSATTLVRNGVLAASVVLAASTLAYTVAVPQPGQSFSQLQLLTESGSGDLVTAGYPTNATADSEESVHLRVENHENERATYTLVVKLQRVTTDAGTTSVAQERQLRRMERTLSPGETWKPRVEFVPEMTGDDLRLVGLLFEGDVPEDPTREDAYREVYAPMNVTEASSA